MKRRFLVCTVLALILLVSFSAFTVSPASAVSEKSEAPKTEIDKEAVLEARFLNMLNHNFAYNEAFDTVEELTNKTPEDMMKVRNLGRKSLEEVLAKLKELNLELNHGEE